MTQFFSDLHWFLRQIPSILATTVTCFTIFLSCNQTDIKQEIHVLGQVSQTGDMVFLFEQRTSELEKIDSVNVGSDGTFRFIIRPIEPGIYALRFDPGQQVVFIASPGDTIDIIADQNNVTRSIKIEGNEESILLQTFYSYSNKNHRKVDSLQSIVEQHKNDPGFYQLTSQLDSIFATIWEEQRAYEKTFIRDYPGTLAALLVVNYHFGVRPVLSPDTDYSDFKKVDSGLMANYPQNKHTQLFHHWLKEIK